MGNLMNQKEVKRAQILNMLKEDKISQQEAAKRMGISTRQVRRLFKRYQAEGLASPASALTGNPPIRPAATTATPDAAHDHDI